MVELKLNVNILFYVILVFYLVWKNKELIYKGNVKGKLYEGGEIWKIVLIFSYFLFIFIFWKM